jgi:RNA polymerase sigma factor (sigma-70 family)
MDTKTFNEAYKQYANLLIYFAKKFGAPEADIEDLVQEAYLRLYRATPPPASDKIKSFLIVTLKNIIIDRSRKRESKLTSVDSDLTDQQQNALWEVDKCSANALSIVSYVIDELSEEEGGQFFKMYYQEGLAATEIAKRSSTPEGTVRSQIHRFCSKFKDRMRTMMETMDIEDIRMKCHDRQNH